MAWTYLTSTETAELARAFRSQSQSRQRHEYVHQVAGRSRLAEDRAYSGSAWFGRLVGLPVIQPIARFAYDRFADLIYAWNRRKGHW